jgi:hypothetical protein
MSHLPEEELDPQLIIKSMVAVMEALEGHDVSAAFGGCALAAFAIYREGRTLDQNMDLLEEFSLWCHAHMADDQPQTH